MLFEIAYGTRYLFRDKSNSYTPNVERHQQKSFNRDFQKQNFSELETCLTSAEKNLFQNTTVDNVKDNVTRT